LIEIDRDTKQLKTVFLCRDVQGVNQIGYEDVKHPSKSQRVEVCPQSLFSTVVVKLPAHT
jgi:hypothetical protein